MFTLKNYKYYLNQLDCANCAKKIEDTLKANPSLKDVTVNFNTLTLSFKTDIPSPFKEVREIIKKIEPNVIVLENKETASKKDYEIVRLFLALICLGLSLIIKTKPLKEIFLLLAYGLLLYKTFIKAITKIIKSHNIDENLLITISAVGAYLLGEHHEGLMVVLLYVIGKILEDKAVGKSRKAITDLLDLKQTYAHKKYGKTITDVKAEELKVNDVVIVKKGEAIPTDGMIIKGTSLLDTSKLTGESLLEKVEFQSKVLSGSINMGDVIEIKVTHDYYNSTAYKIFELTLNATNNKAKTETTVSKIAQIYTPLVLIIACIIALFLPLFFEVPFKTSLYRALTFLVISCPCAIAISVPLSYFAGIGASSKAKVLVKGSNFLDALTKCDTIIFDKTGTLTTGTFKLSKINIYNPKYTEDKILNLIILGESFSNHPIGKVLLSTYNRDIDLSKVKDFKEETGLGISYKVGKDNIKVGSARYVNTKEKANVFLSVNDELVGGLLFDYNIKDNAKKVIKKLKEYNLNPIMLTGDNASFAKMIANTLGIKEYKYGLLPDEKYQELIHIKKDHHVIFVGDGINDTPSLLGANVGISMGEIGSNSAIESSDIVLMNDNLEGILNVLNIAYKTKKIILMNLIFAITVKLSILLLATLGLTTMAMAVFADTGVTLLTIINTLRILNVKN